MYQSLVCKTLIHSLFYDVFKINRSNWSHYLLPIFNFRNHWGWCINIINTASDSLNFTYSIKNPNPLQFSYNKDGSHGGLYGAVTNKIVDFNILPTPINYGTSQVISSKKKKYLFNFKANVLE